MEYQKIINFLDNISDQPSQFKAKNWVEMNNGWYGTYKTGSPIKFKISMIRSGLYD